MRHSQAQPEDSRLEAERRRTFKGSARVSLDVLHFQRHKHRDLDRKHVEFLKHCFRKDECRRLEVRNHVEVEIDQQILDVALHNCNVTAHELLTNQPDGCPLLSFPAGFHLDCLHGQHRIQAAREFLLPTDKWWTVDFYTSDINEDLKTCLNEQHSNEDAPSDGEAYYKIRHYHFQRDIKSELRWKAGLRGVRLKNLKELLADEQLTAGFDALLDIPGVWDGMRLTTLQKMMAMGCRDLCLNYLGRIREVLLGLVGNNKHALGSIDSATVKALELRAPRASAADAQILRNQMRGGQIFSTFSDNERDQIWDRLRMVDGLVPSLFTFFRDIQYLKLCVDCLKRLVIVPRRTSVCETLQRKYTGKNQRDGHVRIQVAEGSNFVYQAGTPADGSDLGVRQLVAMAMRDYPHMPADPIREDAVQKATTKADPAVLRSLANLANDLGFDTELDSLNQHPELRTTREDVSPSAPILVTSGPGVAMPHRSGIPRRRAYEEDRQSLYINHLHGEQQDQGEGITSFFVRKSVYLTFFGRPTSTTAGTTYRSPPGSPSGTDGPGRGPTPATGEGLPGSPEQMADIEDIFSSYADHGDDARGDTFDNTSGAADLAATDVVLYLPGEQERQAERQERERVERERRNLKRREQERRARAKDERRREQARLAEERLMKEKEQERLEQERLEQARLEQERLEQERLEQERLKKLEEQRVEQERLKKLEEQRVEQERLKKLEEQRVEQERLKKLEEQRVEQERLKRLEEERLEQERLKRLEEQRLEHREVFIKFVVYERGSWRDMPPVHVNSGDPSEVERIAKKYMRKNIRTLNTKLQMLAPQECFQAVVDDQTHTILLVPQDNLHIDDEMLESASKRFRN